jgi:cytochrome b involved in lipid metabolism
MLAGLDNSSVVIAVLIVLAGLLGVYSLTSSSSGTPISTALPTSVDKDGKVIQRKRLETAKQKVLKHLGNLTAEDVSKHAKKDDAWIIVDGKVYDVTSYVDTHPGGDAILTHAGGDASEGFHGPQHPPSVPDVLATYYIGDLVLTPQ